MPYLLNLAYLLLILVSLPWLAIQSIRKGKYREGYAEKFLGLAPRRKGDRVCVWLHAVSVGEVNLLAPLLRTIQQERPDWQCVVSTTTASGMALAEKEICRPLRLLLSAGFQLGVRQPCGGFAPACSSSRNWNSGRILSARHGKTAPGWP